MSRSRRGKPKPQRKLSKQITSVYIQKSFASKDIREIKMPEQQTIDDYIAGTYFNTTHESGVELKRSRKSCGDQEVVIAEMFRNHGRLSPSQAHRLYPDNGTPLTSIRRAITVLTNKGLLQKTDEQVRGVYGKPEYIWKYKLI